MATLTLRGKAAVSGLAGAFDVIVYPEPQTGDATLNFDSEVVKDRLGNDCAERGRNPHIITSFKMKLLGDSLASAKTGAAFMAPLAIVTLSAFDLADWNGAYSVQSGEKNSLVNTAIGDKDITLKRYTDPTQNALMTSIPS